MNILRKNRAKTKWLENYSGLLFLTKTGLNFMHFLGTHISLKGKYPRSIWNAISPNFFLFFFGITMKKNWNRCLSLKNIYFMGRIYFSYACVCFPLAVSLSIASALDEFHFLTYDNSTILQRLLCELSQCLFYVLCFLLFFEHNIVYLPSQPKIKQMRE